MIHIKTEQFEGPLGLLLGLIEKEEMDITQISLAKIADQYIEYIRASNNINPEEMADFLVVAAKLLLIKSRALLPYLYPEEEKEIMDLENQLKMYREFIEASKKIEAILKKKKFMFSREFNRKVILNGINIFNPPKNLEKTQLKEIFLEILGSLTPPQQLDEEILEEKINIEDKIAAIQAVLFNRIKNNFSQIVKEAKSKTEVIVYFLAMLELIKQKDIVVEQQELFAEIFIEKLNN